MAPHAGTFEDPHVLGADGRCSDCGYFANRGSLTVADLEAGYGHEAHGELVEPDGSSSAECPGWLGFGYLGERRNVLAAIAHEPGYGDWSVGERGREDIAAADAAVLERANALGWSAHALFYWANSRDGRHFADSAFEGPDGLARALGWSVAPGGSGLGSAWSR